MRCNKDISPLALISSKFHAKSLMQSELTSGNFLVVEFLRLGLELITKDNTSMLNEFRALITSHVSGIFHTGNKIWSFLCE